MSPLQPHSTKPHTSELLTPVRANLVTLDFFDDIIVPSPTNLLKPSRFDRREAVWIWTSDSEHFYFDKNERVRLRIESEIWNDRGPLNLDPTVNRLPPAVTPSNGPAAVAGAADKVRLWDETGGLGRVDGDERDGPRFRPVDEMDREWDGSDEGDEEDDVQMDVGQKEDIKMDWCTWGLVVSFALRSASIFTSINFRFEIGAFTNNFGMFDDYRQAWNRAVSVY